MLILQNIILISTLCFLLLSVKESHGVDRRNFKTCNESGFCHKNRGLAAGDSKYIVNVSTLKVYPSYVDLLGINTRNDHKFRFQLFGLSDGNFRLKINELSPLRPRYEVEYALVGEPATVNLEIEERSEHKVTFKCGNNKATIHAKPFRLDLFIGNELVATANARGLLNFEHMHKKQEKPVEHEGDKDVEHEGDENEEDLDPNNLDDPVQQQPPPQDENVESPDSWHETFKSHTDTRPNGPNDIGLDVTFLKVENVYGIPLHADSFALKDTKSSDPYRLYNFDVFEYELYNPMALYGSVPVVMAHGPEHTVGMFWHNSAETWVDINLGSDKNVVDSLVNFVSGGTEESYVDTHWMSESGVIDVFFLMGPGPKDVMRQYTKLTGTTALPQYFALAYHQCRWNYNDEDDVRGVDEGFDHHNIPYDVLWLDIEYTDDKKYFTWDKHHFPNPTEMIYNLTSKGRKLVTIIDPHIKRESGYFVHTEATNNGYYVKNRNGGDYDGWCWPGSSSYLDFFNPEIRRYWSSLFDVSKFEGTTVDVHIWNDMNEPSVFNGPEVTMPKDCIHHGGWEHRDVHNQYGLVNVMATFKGLYDRSHGHLRPFILTRSHFAGTQRYAAVWTGDNMAKWEHLAITVPMCLSLSIAGISFCGADVGGFFFHPEAELITRWYQAAAFQPFFRNHAHIDTRRREPWTYDENSKNIIRDTLRKRYSYLPMWYTLFAENERTGVPPMRPLWMEYPTDSSTYKMDDEYMLGDMLLVKPVTTQGTSEISVYFPGTVWYDIDTYVKYTGPSEHKISVPIEKIPVFQRGGTIIPKKERIRRSSSLTHNDPYTLIVALDEKGEANGTLYIDDGESYDYQKGQYLYLSFEYKGNKLTARYLAPNAQYDTKSWLERVIICGIDFKPNKIEVTSKSIGTTSLLSEYIPSTHVLIIRKPGVSMKEEWSIVMQ